MEGDALAQSVIHTSCMHFGVGKHFELFFINLFIQLHISGIGGGGV